MRYMTARRPPRWCPPAFSLVSRASAANPPRRQTHSPLRHRGACQPSRYVGACFTRVEHDVLPDKRHVPCPPLGRTSPRLLSALSQGSWGWGALAPVACWGRLRAEVEGMGVQAHILPTQLRTARHPPRLWD